MQFEIGNNYGGYEFLDTLGSSNMVLACQVRNVPTNRSRDACFVGLTGRAIPVHHQRQHYHRTNFRLDPVLEQPPRCREARWCSKRD